MTGSATKLKHRILQQTHRHTIREGGFRSIVRVSAAGMVVVNADNVVQYANPAAGRLLGNKSEILAGRVFSRPLTPDQVQELQIPQRDGCQWLEVHTARIEWEGDYAFLLTLFDITERKHMQQTLQASEARFQTIFEQSPVGITVWRGDMPLYANAACRRMFGFENFDRKDDLINWLRRIAPDSREQVLHQAQDHEPGGVTVSTWESVARRTDGSRFPVQAVMTSLAWADGPATLVFLLDISDRKRAEEALHHTELLYAELGKERELLELKEHFISMVSHEFRNPLTVILSSSELLEMYTDRLTDVRRLEYIHRIKGQAKWMVEMLESVLTISRAEAGKLVFTPVPLDLKQFCMTVLEKLRLTHQPVHQLTFIAEGLLDGIWVDENLLQHALLNLLSNAVKYSPAGGEIALKLLRQADEVVIQISDNGIGIPLEDQKHLFEPFHRARNTKRIHGTGLGLTIVKNSVEIHGGTILFESKEGVGTTFTIRLPVSQKIRILDRSPVQP